MMQTSCGDCGMKLAVRDELAGKSILCPGCRSSVKLPKETPAAEEVRPAPATKSQREESIRTFEAPPRSRYPAQREEEDEDDCESRPSRRRKRRPSRWRSAGFRLGWSGYTIFLISAIVIGLFLLGLALLVPEVLAVALIFCVTLNVVGSLWFLGVAFGEGVWHGLGCIFLPFYFLVFALGHFDEAKDPLYLLLTGAALGGLGLLVATRNEQAARGPRPAEVAVAPVVVPVRPVERPIEPVERPEPERPVVRPDRPVRPKKPVDPPEPVAPAVKLGRPDPADPGKVGAGLRAHWAFDEGAGTMAKDSGPLRLEAALNGCAWVEGVRGKAVQLNGVADYVRLSAAPALSFPAKAPFTVAAWVKTANPKGVVLSLRPMKDSPYDMLNVVLRKGALVVQIRHQGNLMYPDEAVGTQSIHDDAWHHFAVIRGNDGEVYFFVDGTLQGKAAGKLSRGPQSGILFTNNRVIGAEAMLLTGNRHPLYDPSYFDGCMDDLCFYGTALGVPEVGQLSKRE